MDKMFCNQCEQTARRSSSCSPLNGCTISGVCGKKPEVAEGQDELTKKMILLAKLLICSKKEDESAVDLIVDGLFTTITNVSFDEARTQKLMDEISIKCSSVQGCGGSCFADTGSLFEGEANEISLKSTLLFGLRGMAAYAHHARVLGRRDAEVDAFFVTGMAALGESHTIEEWLDLLMKFGEINFKCMSILDDANTSAYGDPVPTTVPLKVEKGPFIVVTGHDLRDISMLLEQAEGRGVNVYSHSEMLPAHGYPKLKKFSALKGNFGTAWQNQQKEFDGIPAPILFTTNCLMPVKDSYRDRVYTTSVVAYPEMIHIAADENGYKDFSEIIDHAIRLGGYSEDREFSGINGGKTVQTGFGRKTILDNAPAIIDAVKGGAIKHFFLIGGCDGAKTGRNYYTEFAQKTPADTIILTLACGKYRLNDLDLGSIGGFPRILDMGQCNDAYGAIQVALALASAFDCGVNDLPLTLVLSWYEQKAVCILLTLLALGVKNIYIGPSLPAFFSDDVLALLVEKFDLHPITTPDADLASILKS